MTRVLLICGCFAVGIIASTIWSGGSDWMPWRKPIEAQVGSGSPLLSMSASGFGRDVDTGDWPAGDAWRAVPGQNNAIIDDLGLAPEVPTLPTMVVARSTVGGGVVGALEEDVVGPVTRVDLLQTTDAVSTAIPQAPLDSDKSGMPSAAPSVAQGPVLEVVIADAPPRKPAAELRMMPPRGHSDEAGQRTAPVDTDGGDSAIPTTASGYVVSAFGPGSGEPVPHAVGAPESRPFPAEEGIAVAALGSAGATATVGQLPEPASTGSTETVTSPASSQGVETEPAFLASLVGSFQKLAGREFNSQTGRAELDEYCTNNFTTWIYDAGTGSLLHCERWVTERQLVASATFSQSIAGNIRCSGRSDCRVSGGGH